MTVTYLSTVLSLGMKAATRKTPTKPPETATHNSQLHNASWYAHT